MFEPLYGLNISNEPLSDTSSGSIAAQTSYSAPRSAV